MVLGAQSNRSIKSIHGINVRSRTGSILWMAAIARTDHHEYHHRRSDDMLRHFYEYIYIFTTENVNF